MGRFSSKLNQIEENQRADFIFRSTELTYTLTLNTQSHQTSSDLLRDRKQTKNCDCARRYPTQTLFLPFTGTPPRIGTVEKQHATTAVTLFHPPSTTYDGDTRTTWTPALKTSASRPLSFTFLAKYVHLKNCLLRSDKGLRVDADMAIAVCRSNRAREVRWRQPGQIHHRSGPDKDELLRR